MRRIISESDDQVLLGELEQMTAMLQYSRNSDFTVLIMVSIHYQKCSIVHVCGQKGLSKGPRFPVARSEFDTVWMQASWAWHAQAYASRASLLHNINASAVQQSKTEIIDCLPKKCLKQLQDLVTNSSDCRQATQCWGVRLQAHVKSSASGWIHCDCCMCFCRSLSPCWS